MDFDGYGYKVESCPRSAEETMEAAFKLNCTVDENGRNQYVCVPIQILTALVQFCFTKTVMALYQKGNCLIAIQNGFLDQINCSNFSDGCPTGEFRGTDLYKYPACQLLNTEKRCFVAHPTCYSSVMVRTSTAAPFPSNTNTTFDFGEVYTTFYEGIIIGVFAPFFIVILACIFWRRGKRSKGKKPTKDIEKGGDQKKLKSSYPEEPKHNSENEKSEVDPFIDKNHKEEVSENPKQKDILCDMCQEAATQSHCELCHRNFCKDCVGTHLSDSTQRHSVVPYNQKTCTPKYPRCIIHIERHCEIYCGKCSSPVCSVCIVSGNHLEHEFLEIPTKITCSCESEGNAQ